MKRQILSVWGKQVWAAVGLLGLGILSLAAGAAPESRGAEKWPRPTGQELSKAEKVVQEVFGRDMQKALTPRQKADLAREILRAAREEQDPAVRWAALQTARRLAVSAQDGRLGLEIVREIVDRFQPLEEMPPADRLAEADRLWQQAERLNGQEKLAKQLEAAEEYILVLPNTNQLTTLKIENRLQTLWLSGRCRLQNCFSGLVLGVRESQTHPGADVIQWDTPEHVKDSWWQIEKVADHVRFRNENSGLYLGVKKLQPGGQLCQCASQDKSTYWRMELMREAVKLKNVVTGLYIDAPWKEKGWLPMLADPKNSPSQLWRLLP